MPDETVSRRSFDRERASRLEAERLLEEKSRELYFANEKLREANRELERRIDDATARLRGALANARAASETKSAFLANVSHEVRTPLTAIIGFTELALKDPGVVGTSRDWLTKVRRNADHLLELLNDVLDLSKIEAGEMHIERIAVDPCELAVSVVDLVRPLAERKGLPIEVSIDQAVPRRIASDPLRLRQILTNLLSNAIKFTDEGGVSIAVCAVGDDRIAVTVSDTGIGVAPDRLESIFEAFSQADESTTRRYGGTGLGLAVSRAMATLVGGELTVESSWGVGSSFTLSVPANTIGLPAVDPAAARLNGGKGKVADDALAGQRVLVVDDVEDNRVLIEALLESRGARVVCVVDGRQGIDAALDARDAGRPFAVVLMDVQMPVLDGHDATRKLREVGYDGWIVSLSANAMAGDAERSLSAGCDRVLSKPIDGRRLIATCAELASRSRSLAA